MATVCAILDGHMEFAERELADGSNVPRHVLETVTKQSGRRKPTLEIKVAAAKALTLELGMAAFGAYIFNIIDIKPNEEKKARELLAAAIRAPLREIYGKK